jgi:hypothetical protein
VRCEPSPTAAAASSRWRIRPGRRCPIPYIAQFDGQDWQPLVRDPILVEDLSLELTDDRESLLRWRLAAEAVGALASVAVATRGAAERTLDRLRCAAHGAGARYGVP